METNSSKEAVLALLHDAGLNRLTTTSRHDDVGVLDLLSKHLKGNGELHHVEIDKTGSSLRVATGDEHFGILRNGELPSLSLRIWYWLNDGTIPNTIFQPSAASKVAEHNRVIPVVPILRKKSGEFAAYFRSKNKKNNSALSAFAGLPVAAHARLLNCETISMQRRYTEYPSKIRILEDLLARLESSGSNEIDTTKIIEVINLCKSEQLWERLEAINQLAELLQFDPQVIEHFTNLQRELLLILKVFTQLAKSETLLDLVNVDHGHYNILGNATCFFVHEEKLEKLFAEDPTLTANQFVEHPDIIEFDPRVIVSDPHVFCAYEPYVFPIDFDRVTFSLNYPEHLENVVDIQQLLQFLNSTNEHEVLLAIHYLPFGQWREHIVPRFSQWPFSLQKHVLLYLRAASSTMSNLDLYQTGQELIFFLLNSAKRTELVEFFFDSIMSFDTKRHWDMLPISILSELGLDQFPTEVETDKWFVSTDSGLFLLALAFEDDLWLRDDVVSKLEGLPDYLQLTCIFYLHGKSSFLSEKVLDQNQSMRQYIISLAEGESSTLRNAALLVAKDYDRTKSANTENDKLLFDVPVEEISQSDEALVTPGKSGKTLIKSIFQGLFKGKQG